MEFLLKMYYNIISTIEKEKNIIFPITNYYIHILFFVTIIQIYGLVAKNGLYRNIKNATYVDLNIKKKIFKCDEPF